MILPTCIVKHPQANNQTQRELRPPYFCQYIASQKIEEEVYQSAQLHTDHCLASTASK